MVLFVLSCNIKKRSIGQRPGCFVLPSCFILVCSIPNIRTHIYIRSLFLLLWKRNVLSTVNLPRIPHIADVYFAFCILRRKKGMYNLELLKGDSCFFIMSPKRHYQIHFNKFFKILILVLAERRLSQFELFPLHCWQRTSQYLYP